MKLFLSWTINIVIFNCTGIKSRCVSFKKCSWLGWERGANLSLTTLQNNDKTCVGNKAFSECIISIGLRLQIIQWRLIVQTCIAVRMLKASSFNPITVSQRWWENFGTCSNIASYFCFYSYYTVFVIAYIYPEPYISLRISLFLEDYT